MERSLALLVHASKTPLTSLQQYLEGRGFTVYTSASWEEAERLAALVPVNRLKYVFMDVALYHTPGWKRFMRRVQASAADTVFIGFQPKFPHNVYSLLGDGEKPRTEKNAGEMSVLEPTATSMSMKFRDALKLADRYAQYDITVLITGETGAGKEVIARYIHARSARKDKPFVACNMTAITETLVQSELFGYVKGAFTGADKNKKGLIEAAEGGTLFLDEIGDLAPSIQLKLLRFLESREFYRVGEATPKTADVRILAATNKILEQAIQENRFREDLYYRLNSARIILPPLRERKEDILRLAELFIEQTCRQTRQPGKQLSQSVQAFLLEYPWPGNIRELKNAIESAVMVAEDEYITIHDLPMHLQHYATSYRETLSLQTLRRIDQAERAIIEEALQQTSGDKVKAAQLLGVSVRTLYRKLEKFSFTPGTVSPAVRTPEWKTL
ncbi:MAG TPA: sigma-54 dependent transcriptional regulator [Methylomirabilota bacterium]|nr:sigma-54 dependent transcriptional regulator [Methylomirabilota bacterium]